MDELAVKRRHVFVAQSWCQRSSKRRISAHPQMARWIDSISRLLFSNEGVLHIGVLAIGGSNQISSARSAYQGLFAPVSVNLPVGPSLARRARRTASAAPSSTVWVP